MDDRPGCVVAGASGRMGQMLIEEALGHPGLRLVAALERPGHDWIGRDLGAAMGRAPLGATVHDDPLEALRTAAIVLDFTSPAATLDLAAIAAQARAVHVIGTTGLSADDIAALEPAARHSVQVRAGNMSLGVNLLVGLTRKVAAALDESFDIEIVETHHRHKVDAPSGTALMLGDAAAEGRGKRLEDVAERGRDGITGARAQGAIGFASLRGGDVVGEHEVVFAGTGERLVLGHIATDRRIFAKGSIKAGLWGLGRPPGSYDMMDVLGLK
ncbi:MAG: 4-hydroxy-tetrahydrodipicolinate reductase [Paracoccaceae bacterium]|nr:4-hydroxy-tetrahydrodipicolinate reductase [Paracoccaceae bacterium]